MKRRTFIAALYRAGESDPFVTSTAYAMNSAIRATEALAREYARGRQIILTGQLPSREGNVYRRAWTGPGVHLTAVARPVEG